ncbi:hypothetical protein N0V83_000596 [Neocucurbitaria cava]|uniref:Uncharacterized protein n=1 Tax=Neocucurbitaria cava TaxID=798079 RepID=A0A9W9CRB8_9PLEO|nr:hypothetical protein N0V83_000596 [Neocucurbitaria cava]
MDRSVKKTKKEHQARLKAQTQRVYISGLAGHHSLETGVAYHYRGHFIYSYPAGTPLEPLPYCTRGGINVVGVAQDRTPNYDPRAADLVPETSITALHRTSVNLRQLQQEREAAQKEETAKALEEEAQEAKILANSPNETAAQDTLQVAAYERLSGRPTSRTAFSTAPSPLVRSASHARSRTSLSPSAIRSHRQTSSSSDVPQISTFLAPSMPSSGAETPEILISGSSYTPHDRAQYLAYSAPGSRPESPTHGLGYRGPLRAVASTSRLNQLLAEEGIQRAFTPLSDVVEGTASRTADAVLDEDMIANLSVEEYIDPEDITTFIQTVSRPPSRISQPPSRPLSGSRSSNHQDSDDDMNEALYLPGLGHPDILRGSGTGRPRKASIALNEAYNAANPPAGGPSTVHPAGDMAAFENTGHHASHASPARVAKCPLHGGSCDGVTTTDAYRTQEAREGKGFKDLFPSIECPDGRVMVDWARLRDEEKAKIGM